MQGIVFRNSKHPLFVFSLILSLLLPLAACDSNKEQQTSQATVQSVTVTLCQPTGRIFVIYNLLCKFMRALPPNPQGIFQK